MHNADMVSVNSSGYQVPDLRNLTFERIDSRVEGWFLMSSAKPVVFVVLVYLAIVTYGPRVMRNRQPYKLNFVLFVYNLLLTILSFYILKELVVESFRTRCRWFCTLSPDPADDLRIVSAMHLFFVSKVIEFLDTVFIIARKKNQQLSFLHVYHHSTMFVFCWVIVRWAPVSGFVSGGITNSFVHVLMYSYYALASFGPNVSKYLFWKRYITIVQLIQFVIGLSLGVTVTALDCPGANTAKYIHIGYMITYLYLFGHFYLITYISKTKKVH